MIAMRAASSLLLGLTLGCASTGAQGSRALGYADRVAADLGIPYLRERADPMAVREIRIWWITGGYMVPEAMTRIVELEDGAAGHQYVYWHRSDARATTGTASPRANGLLDVTGWRARVDEPWCRGTRTGHEFTLCERRFGQRVDWVAVLGRLDSLEIERAPSPPGCPLGLDGWRIVVEVRRGTRYRQYDCWAPEEEDASGEVRRIAHIWNAAWRAPER